MINFYLSVIYQVSGHTTKHDDHRLSSFMFYIQVNLLTTVLNATPVLPSGRIRTGCQIFISKAPFNLNEWEVKYFQILMTPLISTRLRWCQTTLSVWALVCSWSGSPPSPSTSGPPSSVEHWQPMLTNISTSRPVLWCRGPTDTTSSMSSGSWSTCSACSSPWNNSTDSTLSSATGAFFQPLSLSSQFYL